MFIETDEYAEHREQLSPPDLDRATAQVDRWFADHADAVRGTITRLHDRWTATTVRRSGSLPETIDGPFAHGSEALAGFAEVEVADLDEALRLARDWPACPIVEIRPLQQCSSWARVEFEAAPIVR